MMIRYFTISIFLLLCFSNVLQAQESVYPLSFRPELGENQKHAVKSADSKIIWQFATMEIPFMDDFTRRRSVDYDTSKYTTANYQQFDYYSFRVNNQVFQTVAFMYDESYDYFFNTGTGSIDSFPKPSIQIDFYENLYSPLTPTSSITAWPAYFRPNFDSNGNVIDTTFIQPDSAIAVVYYDLYIYTVPSGWAHWVNKSAYINNHFAKNPPSLGVATFDGLDSIGKPYQLIPNNLQGPADELTSVPFNLGYDPSSNIYFSFFYQPEGLGNRPEPEDSLVLEFKVPGSDWKRIWSKIGHAIPSDSSFRRVVISINDTTWLKSGFRFRFRNFATLSGSLDHWHIDYVKIDLNADTVITDITWVDQGRSLFKSFTQMPYRQYTSSLTPDIVSNRVRNIGNSAINVDFRFLVNDYGGTVYNTLNVGNVDFNSNAINQCNNCNQILNPLIGNSFSLPESTICARFSVIQTIINIQPEPNRSNDTLIATQLFGDVYAYDDGTAEAAYGLNSAYGQMATKFSLRVADTLKAVRFYFNPTVEDVTIYPFTIVVWEEDANGRPGQELYRRGGYYLPQFSPTINGFVEYPIDDATLILNGNFFVGLEQLNPTTIEYRIGQKYQLQNQSILSNSRNLVSNPVRWLMDDASCFWFMPL
jgi:hypothetical protein